jgi:DNA polymerase-3 subunit delta
MLLGDGSRAVRIMDGLAAEGEEPTLVLWVVAEELRSILQSGAKSGSSGRLFKGGALRKERLAMAARRVPKRLVQDLLLQAAQVDGMIKSARKDEAWGALTKIATTLCIAVKNRAG